MSNFQFEIVDAAEIQSKARIGLAGPAGSGKTWTALELATVLAEGGDIIYIDTENRSAAKYAANFKFKVLPLSAPYSPEKYIAAIQYAVTQQAAVVAVDSLSHAWAGEGGALEMVDKAAARYKNNSYMAWRDVTPWHNKLVDALVQCPAHLIVAMRTKTEYALETDDRGKVVPKKLGLAPIQREGMDYEMDIVFELDLQHRAFVTKTRFTALDGEVIEKPGKALGQQILEWLNHGAPAPEPVEIINKEALIAYAAGFGLKATDVAQVLKNSEIGKYDETRWTEMKALIAASVAA